MNGSLIHATTILDESIDQRFRETMAHVAAPVSVVTALGDEGPHGTTVSAFASLSMDPPMLLVSLDQGSQLLNIVRTTGKFGVNILSANQDRIARTFAQKGADKFDGVDWTASFGLPRLSGTVGWVACDSKKIIPGGDHMILLGHVVDVHSYSVPPLSYHARTFGTHLPHTAA